MSNLNYDRQIAELIATKLQGMAPCLPEKPVFKRIPIIRLESLRTGDRRIFVSPMSDSGIDVLSVAITHLKLIDQKNLEQEVESEITIDNRILEFLHGNRWLGECGTILKIQRPTICDWEEAHDDGLFHSVILLDVGEQYA